MPIQDRFQLSLPWGYKILSFQLQNGKPVIWTLVDTNHAKDDELFFIYGTGNPIDNENVYLTVYIGTIQLDGLVWHLFSDRN